MLRSSLNFVLPMFLGKKAFPLLALSLWSLAVGAGFKVLLDYEKRPGAAAVSSSVWPAGIPSALASNQCNLVLIGHPKCPCTRTSVAELEEIMSRCRGKLKATAIFLQPSGETEEWSKTGLWRRSASIPGVECIADLDGRLAAKFGASTSGQVLLFDGNGRLLFSGGITGGRGHEGDNPGSSAVIAAVSGGAINLAHTPVFGCSLLDAKSEREGTP
jgi:hypothetical protein